MFKDKK